jgi:Polyprenyl synthetase
MALSIENPKPEAEAGLNDLVALVADGMARVNTTILSRTGSEVAMIPEVANHLIASGGKRLRPILTLACAKLCGYAGETDGDVKLAASVEFMHTATLLHDDVVDESDMRRGRVAARIKWGNEASVLVGDFLLGQAFRMMVEVGSLRALDILSAAATVIAEGEVMQLTNAKNLETDEAAYLAVIRGKTAELFAAACEVGPVLAGRPEAEQAAARASARMSATISARARSPCRSCWPTAGAARASAASGGGRCSRARSATATWRRPWTCSSATAPWRRPWRAPSITAPRPGRPSTPSRTALSRRRCSAPWSSASRGRAEAASRLSDR